MQLDNSDANSTDWCLCLPEAELNTKNSTKWQVCCRFVEFFFIQLYPLEKSVSANKEKLEDFYSYIFDYVFFDSP